MVSCDCCLISLWYERYKKKDQVGKWNVCVTSLDKENYKILLSW